jgi:SAM-dependent methyltransferase
MGSRFWNVWAPYWSHIEDNYLDLESLDRLSSIIQSPVLVVGAGQGLLVEHLGKKGLAVHGVDLDPLMIEYARKRRGLRMILADGTRLPLAGESSRTTIVATGVVDLMDDEHLIRSIITDAVRVTRADGAVLVAFYRLNPGAERLFRSAGLITDEDRLLQKIVYEMATMSVPELIATVSRLSGVGSLRALLMLARFPLTLPARERRMARSLTRMLKKATRDLGSPDPLLDSAIEEVPFRSKESIEKLFSRLDLPLHEMHMFDTCHVVRTGRAP